MATPDSGANRGAHHAEPAEILTQDQFAQALTLRRSQCGLTIRDVSRMTNIPLSTLGGYFSGRHLPPVSQPEAVATLLSVLGVPAEDVSAWQSMLARLRQLDGRRRTSSDTGPYRGLESYGIEDAEWFVGRETLVDELLAVHDELSMSRGRPRVHVVVGASGSGKSSVLHAGALARLRGRGSSVAALVPGSDPDQALRKCLGTIPGGAPDVLVVDQFEELFAIDVEGSTRRSFLEEITRLADPVKGPGAVVFLALRADFYVDAVNEPLVLPWLERSQTLVGPMTDAELRTVVTEPAARAGIPVEPELVELVLQDLAPREGALTASALPLLSHALLETWKRASGTALTVADYVGVGRIAGAVQRSAEAVYANLSPEGQAAARAVFSLLVSVDDEGVATRRRVEHGRLPKVAGVEEAVSAFVTQRILTTSTDTVEISHEALLDAWPRLRTWIDADRDQLRLRRRLTQGALGWQEQGRDPDGLLRGNLLALVQELPETVTRALPTVEQDFLEASVARDQARTLAERRRRRRLNRLFASIAALAAMSMVLSLVLVVTVHRANLARHAANSARDDALSRQVAIQANRLRDSDPALATQLSLAAYDISPTVEARSSVLDAAGSAQSTRLVGPDGLERAAASPDGHTIAVAGADGKVRFYRRRSDAAVPELDSTVTAGKGGPLFAAAFSPDGRLFAVGGTDATITVFDMADPSHPVAWPRALTGPRSTVQGLSFSPDGRELLAATSDPGLFRWALRHGRAALTAKRTKLAAAAQSVAIDRGGLIATGAADGSVELWRAERGRFRLLRRLPAGQSNNVVYAVAFSPDGRLLAAGGKDRLVRLWDVSGDPKPAAAPLTGPASWVNALAFNPSGTALAAAASGASIQVWSTRDWSLKDSFPGTANFTSVQFLAHDEQLLSGAVDGVTRIWSLVSPRLPAFKDSSWAVSYTGDGARMYVAVGTEDPSVVELDASDPLHPRRTGRVFRGPSSAGSIAAVAAVKPDGSELAAGTTTGNIVIWKLGPGHASRPVGTLHAAGQLVENVTYSRDGTLLAATSDDGTVAVYDTTGVGLPRLVHRLDAKALALGVDISPDDSFIAVGAADYKVHWWRLSPRTATALRPISGFTNYAYSVQFSPDGQTLAGGSTDRTVRLWKVSDPDHPRLIGSPLRGPANTVFSIAFSRDGRFLAGASQDGAVWVWKRSDPSTTPTLYAKLDSVGTPLYSVHADPAADGFAAVGALGQADYWPTDIDATARTLCSGTGTPISRQEWSQYVAGAAYRAPCPTLS